MTCDVCIVGGGIVGCATAAALARAGAGRIVVVDRAVPGAGASGAAAGLLAVASGRAPGGALFELKRAALARFPAFVERLQGETGCDVAFHRRGILRLAFSDEEYRTLSSLAQKRRAQGFRAEVVEGHDVGRFAAGINPTVRGAVWFADEAQVEPRRLVTALCRSAQARGVVFRDNARVTGAEIEGERVAALRAGPDRIVAGEVVVAAGAGSAEVGRVLGVRIPVRPDRGEMVALGVERPPRRPLCWDEGYLVPQPAGELWVGSTSRRGEEEPAVTAGGLALLLERARRMVPGLSAAPVLRAWAGLRPCPTIRRPLIGPVPGYRNLTVATGHHRSGILLGPLTGELLAQVLTRGETEIDLSPFAWRRR